MFITFTMHFPCFDALLVPLHQQDVVQHSFFKTGMLKVHISLILVHFTTSFEQVYHDKVSLFRKVNTVYSVDLLAVVVSFDYYWLYTKGKVSLTFSLHLSRSLSGDRRQLDAFMPSEYFIEYLHFHHNRISNSSFQHRKQRTFFMNLCIYNVPIYKMVDIWK